MASQFKTKTHEGDLTLKTSTVLPRLGSSRMKSHQNLHTHAVDSAIQLQRCTLSQLRSGHCHLLQDYKHRLLGKPSDICKDCGTSPQDVRHLFACTTHPTDLSPEDLWRSPVRSIRAFSYLDNGNLDCLDDGPGRGQQQQLTGLHKNLDRLAVGPGWMS